MATYFIEKNAAATAPNPENVFMKTYLKYVGGGAALGAAYGAYRGNLDITPEDGFVVKNIKKPTTGDRFNSAAAGGSVGMVAGAVPGFIRGISKANDAEKIIKAKRDAEWEAWRNKTWNYGKQRAEENSNYRKQEYSYNWDDFFNRGRKKQEYSYNSRVRPTDVEATLKKWKIPSDIKTKKELESFHKKLQVKHHPDRFSDPKDKATNEEVLKQFANELGKLKKTTWFNKLAALKQMAASMSDTTERNVEVGAATAGGAGTLYYGNKLRKLRHDPKEIAITYGYLKGAGGGHLAQAKAYKELLDSKGYKSKLINSNPMAIKEMGNVYKYKGNIDTGWGIGGILNRGSRRIKHTPSDYNPRMAADELIPLRKSSRAGKVSEKQYKQLLSEITGSSPDSLTGKKIITITGGESGSGVINKYNKIREALGNRKDYHIITMSGNAKPEVKKQLAEYAKLHGNLSDVGFVPQKKYKKLVGNSNLNIGYGGSSSVTEQFEFKNPQLNVRFGDNPINEGNLQYAKKHYNIPYYDLGKSEQLPGLKTAINDILDSPDKYHAQGKQRVRKYRANKKKFEGKFFSNVEAASKETKILREGLKSSSKKGLAVSAIAGLSGLGALAYDKLTDK